MSYLIQIGTGRPGRWDGFERIIVDEASFQKIEELYDELDMDDFQEPCSQKLYPLISLMLKAGCGSVDVEDFEDDPKIIELMDQWTLRDSGPFLDVYTILIWETDF